jgi:hypothetical protein
MNENFRPALFLWAKIMIFFLAFTELPLFSRNICELRIMLILSCSWSIVFMHDIRLMECLMLMICIGVIFSQLNYFVASVQF